jgi:uncharacterized membrane protein (DUF373 family)
MNILYILGALLMVIILGYAYFIFVKAKNEKGATKITGFTLSGLVVVLLVLLIVLYKTGAIGMPEFMPERPSMRMMQGMSAYTIGMMSDDPKTIDEFIAILETKPELYNQLKDELK